MGLKKADLTSSKMLNYQTNIQPLSFIRHGKHAESRDGFAIMTMGIYTPPHYTHNQLINLSTLHLTSSYESNSALSSCPYTSELIS